MRALGYLYGRIFRNRLSKTLKKPVTYLYLAVILLYIGLMAIGFREIFAGWKMDSPEGMTAVLTVFAFWSIPANLITYARRKGLLYRHSDIHFLFPSPIDPKLNLLWAYGKTLLTNLLLNIVLVIGGIYVFSVAWWRMLLYFLFSVGAEYTLEGSLVLLLYGWDGLREKSRKYVIIACYALVGIFVLLALDAYRQNGLSGQAVTSFLHGDAVQMVPLIGWYIAVLHLLFTGPTAVNVVCSLLYLCLLLTAAAAAVRMRCTGEYYEDAEKFADDYEEAVAKRRQGRTDVRMGKKKKIGKANVRYRGTGAKAIFYRQLLEYKKSRFFIFDLNTVVSLIAGAGISYLYVQEGGFGGFEDFIVPAAMAYMILIFCAYTGKWGKELTMPYTYLIPDNAFRKLFYATAMQHVQALVNGCIFILLPAVFMNLPLSTAVLSVLGYVVLSACKLYVLTTAEVAVGDLLGRVGKQLFQLFVLGIIITGGVFGAVLGFLIGGINLAYILMLAVLVCAMAVLMIVSALGFYRMETVQ